MTDRYQKFVSHGFGKKLSTSVGLPRPAVLRRYAAGAPLVDGPVLAVTLGSSRIATPLSDVLARLEIPLVEDPAGERLGAIVIDATGADHLADLAPLSERVGPALRALRPSGRIVVLSPDASVTDDVEVTATHQAVDGFTRSLAKEARAGATANLVQCTDQVSGPALESTLRFLLSGRSAYVDGQVVHLNTATPPVPADWDRPLAGKIALVTGAARGIGASIAGVLARDGATVVCADLPSAGEALAGVANRIGGSTLQIDISGPGAPAQIADHLDERFGGVDIVVHNAGITRDKLLVNMKPEVWSSVVDINLGAQIRINRALLERSLFRPDSRIVALSSTSGIAGNRGQTNYAASKAGIIGLVRASAPQLIGNGSTINAVAPGFIDTEMTASMPFATREVARRLNSLQQAGLPVDVAETVAWLASPGAGAVTGQVLRVCGQALVGA